jgi:TPP-dependent 2-oxoacid decarboxylase
VGAFKVVNPIGGAYAERSIVLVISGAPGVQESETHRYLHHVVHQNADTQRRLFNEVCASTVALTSARSACQEIAMMLGEMHAHSLPGYIEVPLDRLTRPLHWPMHPYETPKELTEIENLSNLYVTQGLEVLEWMKSRSRPVVLAGFEIQRFGLQHSLLAILEREGWSCATSLTGKTLISELHPLGLGIYNAAMSSTPVRETVEDSDGVLILGMPLDDLDTGMYTMDSDNASAIHVSMKLGLRWGAGGVRGLLVPPVLLKIWPGAGPPNRQS